jgi:hypothetical protein
MSSEKSPAEMFPDIFPPRKICILGAGRFGRIAAERLKGRFPGSSLCIVDKEADKVEAISRELQIRGVVADSLRYITEFPVPEISEISEVLEGTWIIPAIPVHVGFEWVLHELGRIGEIRKLPVPEDAASQVPNPIRSPSGTLYASFATFLCPDYCNEPDEVCTHTGKARPGNLYEVFQAISLPEFDVAVLRSWQLAPGVGGYPVRSLKELFDRVRTQSGKYLVATSCRCHGVVDAVEWRGKTG